MFNGLFQPSHLLLILVVVLIVFGPGKLPEVGKALGKGLRDMRSAFAGSDEEEQEKEKEKKERTDSANGGKGEKIAAAQAINNNTGVN